ncbi:histidinol-phosphatase HisJ family protein [Tissierella sp. MSJ-40]|uniref:Histidinol-phosphatase n=1 Tax=Tissierella simiarum TaxID=2841534 RepID=A0ABS6E4G4_9FIRM|nr:histidinol-phosphatase HisJ family protein [Tissierella simiarum]MBU5437466.1 histidinol-phosphatase HisJ family protein [Tissierella simiarum]
MYDFHVHSDYSIDSKSSMEKMVLSAIDKNMKSICFTDHVDFESTTQKLDIVFRTDDYFRKAKQVKYKYMKDIEILCGVEIGMQPHLGERYEKFIKENPFDYVLMSIHSVNGEDIFCDNFTKGLEPIEALKMYYDHMYHCIKNYKDYDILGHIDYIDRYFENYLSIPKYDDYYYVIESILKLIIENGKGIEVNTAGMKYGLGYFHPKMQILKLYKELGGEIITIGSDAHSPEFVGYEYKAAEKLLRELGFKYLHIFKERKKFPINIG